MLLERMASARATNQCKVNRDSPLSPFARQSLPSLTYPRLVLRSAIESVLSDFDEEWGKF